MSTSKKNGTQPENPTKLLANGTPPAADVEAMSLKVEPEWITVTCEKGAFKGVQVQVNALASRAEINGLTDIMMAGIRQDVIGEVTNWDADKFGDDPFSIHAPMAFLIWVTRDAVAEGVNAYISDPNLSGKSTASSQPTNAAQSVSLPSN